MEENKPLHLIQLTNDENIALSSFLRSESKENICAEFMWCHLHSNDCDTCPVTTMLNKIAYNIKFKEKMEAENEN